MSQSSLMNATPISFVASTQPEEARRFYEKVLGFYLVSDEPMATVFDMGGGQTLRVQKVATVPEPAGTVLGWVVEDIASARGALKAKGVVFEFFGLPGQTSDGICTFPNGDKVAWFRDPDGNMLSLTEDGQATKTLLHRENELPSKAVEALRRGRKIEAIKLLRDDRELTLKEAKELVDRYEIEHLGKLPATMNSQTLLVALILLIVLPVLIYFLFILP